MSLNTLEYRVWPLPILCHRDVDLFTYILRKVRTYFNQEVMEKSWDDIDLIPQYNRNIATNGNVQKDDMWKRGDPKQRFYFYLCTINIT